MKVRWQAPPPGEGPLLRLPAVGLFVGWTAVLALALGGWCLLAPWLGLGPRESTSGLIGSCLVLLVMGAGLFTIKPWIPRHASDLPTTWLTTSVVRLLVVPATAFLLYFAILPAAQPFVAGVVSAYVVFLAVEVLLLVVAMFSQLQAGNPRP